MTWFDDMEKTILYIELFFKLKFLFIFNFFIIFWKVSKNVPQEGNKYRIYSMGVKQGRDNNVMKKQFPLIQFHYEIFG